MWALFKKKNYFGFVGVISLNDTYSTQSGLFTNEQLDKGLQYSHDVVFFILNSLVLYL